MADTTSNMSIQAQDKASVTSKGRKARANTAASKRSSNKARSVAAARGLMGAVSFSSFVGTVCNKPVYQMNGNVKVSQWPSNGTFTLGPQTCSIQRAYASFGVFKLRLVLKGEAAQAAEAFNERIQHVGAECFGLYAMRGIDSYMDGGEPRYVMEAVIRLNRQEKPTGKLTLHVGSNKSDLKMEKLLQLGAKDQVQWDADWNQFNLHIMPYFYLMTIKGIATFGVSFTLKEGAISVPALLVDDVSRYMGIKSTGGKRAPKAKAVPTVSVEEGPTDEEIEQMIDAEEEEQATPTD